MHDNIAMSSFPLYVIAPLIVPYRLPLMYRSLPLIALASAFLLASSSPAYAGCFAEAAERYNVPLALLRAVALQEGGSVGTASHNTNGTVDYGVMQINTFWLDILADFGYTKHTLRWNRCANIHAGAWILARQLKRAGVLGDPTPPPAKLWNAVGNYHSHTPRLNNRYALSVWQHYKRLVSGASPEPDKRLAPLMVYSQNQPTKE